MHTKFPLDILKEIEHMEDLGADWGGNIWAELMCLRIRIIGFLL
jgi:hypothetical protein